MFPWTLWDISYQLIYRTSTTRTGKTHTNRPNKTYNLIQGLLLIISGSVEKNLGSHRLKFPCGLCKKAVKKSENAISCDKCNIWYHKGCLSMGDQVLTVIFKMRPLSGHVKNVHSMIYQHLCSTLQYRQSNQTFRMISPRKNPNNCESQFVTCKASGTNMHS